MDVSFKFASSLLHFEHIQPVVQTLLEKSREYREECAWGEAERCALDAQDFCTEARNHVGLALARLYLADFYRVVGELGQAMDLCRMAYDAIRGQSARAQRHNEAVAAYALGLLCEQQLFGNAMQALHWYQEALKQFKLAQEYWTTLINDRSRTSTRATDAFSEKTTSKQRRLRALSQILGNRFDKSELETFGHDLQTEYDLDVTTRSILIVTVTKVEAQAVLKVFSQAAGTRRIRQVIENKTYYDLGDHGGVPVFMVQQSEMGSARLGGALLTVRQAIQDLHPQVVIMCGIAFGLRPGKQQLGDILVAKQIQSYEPQKVDMQLGHIPRGDRVASAVRLLDRFHSGDLDWQGAPTHFGLVLSSEKLVNDPTFRNRLLRTEPEAVGGEMEGAGLYAAARDAKVDWILVKAICDWADGKKNDDAHLLAASNAAQFVLHVLQRGGWSETEQSLPGKNMADKARQLVMRLERLDAIPKMVELGKKKHPHISWRAKSKAAEEVLPTSDGTTPEQAQSYLDTCHRACQEIEERSDHIVKNRTSQHSWQPAFDIWRPDSLESPFTNDNDLRGYIIDANLIRIGETDYRAKPAIIPDETNYYFALPMSGGDLAVPGPQVSNYVLIRQQWQLEEAQSGKAQPEKDESGIVWESGSGWVIGKVQSKEDKTGVVWESGNGWVTVDFKREPDGSVKFFPHSAQIVGDSVGKIKGCVTALLEPAAPSPKPSIDSPPLSSDDLK